MYVCYFRNVSNIPAKNGKKPDTAIDPVKTSYFRNIANIPANDSGKTIHDEQRTADGRFRPQKTINQAMAERERERERETASHVITLENRATSLPGTSNKTFVCVFSCNFLSSMVSLMTGPRTHLPYRQRRQKPAVRFTHTHTYLPRSCGRGTRCAGSAGPPRTAPRSCVRAGCDCGGDL